ncbi:hypothetical protein [Olivibacter domesticus]|uniref:Uncharacterized protein n=1 Tax=Olivibacter domesticus TaxID=407022 RepID=A0A1H7IFG3_OLID1|nr:hypothetical protein [Olivibacter domesticus]SEK60592.1 hypothetical protein SAMN05661044_00667 [Olivibacter domesticus]
MKIDVKNIELDEESSKAENQIYLGDLHINEAYVGACLIEVGITTLYHARDEPAAALITQAEEYFRQQPLTFYPYENSGKDGELLQPSLRLEIALKVHEHFLKEAAEQRRVFDEFIDKNQKQAIIIGSPGKKGTLITLTHPIADILNFPVLRKDLAELIRHSILPKMEEGQQVLNTNIPVSILQQAGLKESQYFFKGEEQQPPNKKNNGINGPSG